MHTFQLMNALLCAVEKEQEQVDEGAEGDVVDEEEEEVEEGVVATGAGEGDGEEEEEEEQEEEEEEEEDEEIAAKFDLENKFHRNRYNACK